MKPFFSHGRKNLFIERGNRLRRCELRLDDHDTAIAQLQRDPNRLEWIAALCLILSAIVALAEMWRT